MSRRPVTITVRASAQRALAVFADVSAAIANAAERDLERLRLSIEHRHALALRADRLAPLVNLPARDVAQQLERLDAYQPTDEQVVAVLRQWSSTGIDPVHALGALYRTCPWPPLRTGSGVMSPGGPPTA